MKYHHVEFLQIRGSKSAIQNAEKLEELEISSPQVKTLHNKAGIHSRHQKIR